MRWISDAGRRLWRAYCQGLEMSCPVQRLDQLKTYMRNGAQDVANDAARAISGAERPVH